MAPEQCVEASGGAIGAPSDVFGLGATLFHALTGEKPFPRERGAGDSDDPRVRFPQLREEPLPLPAWVPGELSGPDRADARAGPGGAPRGGRRGRASSSRSWRSCRGG